MKTNNYLRAIDKRLGNPVNTYNIINEVTWSVYSKEVAFKTEQTNRWQYTKEMVYYYFVRFLLYLQLTRIRLLGVFGIKAS